MSLSASRIVAYNILMLEDNSMSNNPHFGVVRPEEMKRDFRRIYTI